MKRMILTAAIAAMTGCASIVSDSTYPVSITSNPPGASFSVTSESGMIVSSGVTPGQAVLNAGAGYFDGERYTLSYKKDGYEDGTSVIDSQVDGWYWGNILFGGLIGMLAVDPATGAMYKLPKATSAGLALKPGEIAVATPPANGGGGNMKVKLQMLEQLAADKSLSYDEYQTRAQMILQQ